MPRPFEYSRANSRGFQSTASGVQRQSVSSPSVIFMRYWLFHRSDPDSSERCSECSQPVKPPNPAKGSAEPAKPDPNGPSNPANEAGEPVKSKPSLKRRLVSSIRGKGVCGPCEVPHGRAADLTWGSIHRTKAHVRTARPIRSECQDHSSISKLIIEGLDLQPRVSKEGW